MDTFEITIALFIAAAVITPFIAAWHLKRMRQRDEKTRAERMQRERERLAAQLAAIPKSGPAIRPGASSSVASHSPARSFTPATSPSPHPQPDYLAPHLMWQNIHSTQPAQANETPCRSSHYSSSSSDGYSSGGSSWGSCSSSDSSSSSSSDSGCSSSDSGCSSSCD